MRDRWVRFLTYADWIKSYFNVSTPKSIEMARERAVVYELKGIEYVRIPEHRFKLYKNSLKNRRKK